MPILRWNAAHGDAAPARVACAQTVHLAPWDDSIDTNIIHIAGPGTIDSFGWGQASTKRVLFDAGITLKHSRHLQLLGLRDREIDEPAIGVYATMGDGYWNEISFTATGAAETVRQLNSINRRLDAMYLRIEEIEERLCELIAQEQQRDAAKIQSES
jgi:hypothetical protein